MVQAAEDRMSHYLQVLGNVVPVFLGRHRQNRGWLGNAWPQRHMRTAFIIPCGRSASQPAYNAAIRLLRTTTLALAEELHILEAFPATEQSA